MKTYKYKDRFYATQHAARQAGATRMDVVIIPNNKDELLSFINDLIAARPEPAAQPAPPAPQAPQTPAQPEDKQPVKATRTWNEKTSNSPQAKTNALFLSIEEEISKASFGRAQTIQTAAIERMVELAAARLAAGGEPHPSLIDAWYKKVIP